MFNHKLYFNLCAQVTTVLLHCVMTQKENAVQYGLCDVMHFSSEMPNSWICGIFKCFILTLRLFISVSMFVQGVCIMVGIISTYNWSQRAHITFFQVQALKNLRRHPQNHFSGCRLKGYFNPTLAKKFTRITKLVIQTRNNR